LRSPARPALTLSRAHLQIQHMVSFIQNEAREKAQEIDTKVRPAFTFFFFFCPI
jgi:hypothetical protein